MKTVIISLNFNPGHFSHLIANYKLYQDLGEDPVLYVDSQFIKMDENGAYEKITSLSEIDGGKVKNSVFWFPSLKNIGEIIKLKYKYKSKIAYVFHEPFDSVKNYRNGGFSWSKIAKVYLINLVNIFTIILSDAVILPSDKAYELYKKNYKKFNSNFHKMPLLFDDESNVADKAIPKHYISYVGTIAEDHAFDKFLEFYIFACKHKKLEEFTFQIATKSSMSPELIDKLKGIGTIKIQEGRPLTNKEINEAYANSFVIWNAYNRTMQSGVLPKAFMFGALVVTTKKNADKFVKSGYNAVVVEDNTDYEEICEKIEEMKLHCSSFIENTRYTFLENFYYKNYTDIFKNIFNK